MKLNKGEVIIKEGGAIYRLGRDRPSFLRFVGKLHLTNKRLLFEYFSMSVPHGISKKEVEIPLAAITNVQRVEAGSLKDRTVKLDYVISGEPRILIFEPYESYRILLLEMQYSQGFRVLYPHEIAELIGGWAEVWVTQIRRAAKSEEKKPNQS